MATTSQPGFLRRSPRGVTVELRVQPRARRTMLDYSADTLKASVSAPPEDGRANAAVIALLAGEWHLPQKSFEILKGAASRHKTVSITGDPDDVTNRIVDWLGRHG